MRRCFSVSSSGETSLPHHPPSYGVSSGNPVSSAISGPTSVPCRVITPSIASSRGSIRFITLICSPTICRSCSAQSPSFAMKKVVWPESPYGVCTTRSSPSPAPARQREQRPGSRCHGPSCSARSARRPRCRDASSRSSSPSGAAAPPSGRRRPARARRPAPRSPRRTSGTPPCRAAVAGDEVADLLVPEEVVHDLLDRLERRAASAPSARRRSDASRRTSRSSSRTGSCAPTGRSRAG